MRGYPLKTMAVAFALSAMSAGASAAADEPPLCVGKDMVESARLENPEVFRAFAAQAHSVPNSRGLLWKITRRGTAPSFLYGTIHVTDPRAVELARLNAPIIARSRVVVTELGDALEGGAATALGLKLGLGALFGGGDKLSLIKSPDDRRIVEAALEQRQISAAAANRLEPWMSVMMLAVPKCEADRQRAGLPVVDKVIGAMGRARHLKIEALETLDEQIQVFSGMDSDLLSGILVSMSKQSAQAGDRFVTMLALYHRRSVGTLIEAMKIAQSANERGAEADLERRFLKRLIDDRNAVMAQRSIPFLTKGRAFIAVGALHLPGDAGLVELFRRAGFKVDKVW